jgi:predicted DNA-binding transcriptional regulator YafY
MTAARLKVLAALPTELRSRASRLVERFYLDATAWFRAGDTVPHLPPLAEAVWEGIRVRITYDRGDATVERLVEPLGIVLKGGTWYLVGRRDGEIRTYRVARIGSVELGDRFERPAGFDLEAYWVESSAAFEREAPRLVVVVRVDPEFLDDLAGQLGADVVDDAERLGDDDPDGWTRLRLRMTYPHDAPGRLLGLGSHLEVVEPVEVRQRVVALAGGVLARHADGA